MGDLTKDADLTGSWSTSIKYKRQPRITGFITKTREWDLLLVPDVFMGLVENSGALGSTHDLLRAQDTSVR